MGTAISTRADRGHRGVRHRHVGNPEALDGLPDADGVLAREVSGRVHRRRGGVRPDARPVPATDHADHRPRDGRACCFPGWHRDRLPRTQVGPPVGTVRPYWTHRCARVSESGSRAHTFMRPAAPDLQYPQSSDAPRQRTLAPGFFNGDGQGALVPR